MPDLGGVVFNDYSADVLNEMTYDEWERWVKSRA